MASSVISATPNLEEIRGLGSVNAHASRHVRRLCRRTARSLARELGVLGNAQVRRFVRENWRGVKVEIFTNVRTAIDDMGAI